MSFFFLFLKSNDHFEECARSQTERKKMLLFLGTETHSRADGPEGHHPLDVVGVASAPRLPVRILSSLQHKLLSTEAGVLVSCPAVSDKHTVTCTQHYWIPGIFDWKMFEPACPEQTWLLMCVQLSAFSGASF